MTPESVEVYRGPAVWKAADFETMLEEAMPPHFVVSHCGTHFTPESDEVKILFALAAAASFAPSSEEVMPCISFIVPMVRSSTQFTPESAEVQIFPPSTTAASTTPSLDEVVLRQFFGVPTGACTPVPAEVQVAPESVDV